MTSAESESQTMHCSNCGSKKIKIQFSTEEWPVCPECGDLLLRLLGIGVIGTVLLLMAINLGHSGPIMSVEDGAQIGAPLATEVWMSAGLAGCFVVILGVYAIRQRWNIES